MRQVWDKVETGLRQGLGFLSILCAELVLQGMMDSSTATDINDLPVPTGASIMCAVPVLQGLVAPSTAPDSSDIPVPIGVSILCTELVLTGMASVLHSSSQGRQTAAAAPRRLPPRSPGGASSDRW